MKKVSHQWTSPLNLKSGIKKRDKNKQKQNNPHRKTIEQVFFLRQTKIGQI